MARGIGGEDGPSLWMFVAVILIWAWIKQTTKDVKNSVVDTLEIGQNSAGPLQPETTKQIASLQTFVDKIPITKSKLKHAMPHYQALADDTWSELTSVFVIDRAKLLADVKDLNVYELRAVAKCFGLKEPTVVGLTTHTLTIFKAYEWKLSNEDYLTALKKVWAKTGLWY